MSMTTVGDTIDHRAMKALIVAVIVVVASASAVAAGPASDTLRPAIDEVVRILDDPAMKGSAHVVARRTALRGIIHGVIDFPDAARRALGIHWAARSRDERTRFVTLFTDLVTESYIRQFEPYAGQKIHLLGEHAVDGTVTVVTKVEQRKGSAIPVDYRMHPLGSRWLVYDVIVEGVSLVANYRAQFNTVIQTSSYAELVRRLETRVLELTAPVTAAR